MLSNFLQKLIFAFVSDNSFNTIDQTKIIPPEIVYKDKQKLNKSFISTFRLFALLSSDKLTVDRVDATNFS